MKFLKVTLALLVLSCTSCSFQKIATNAEPTGFISSTGVDTSKKIKRLPFDHSWNDPATDFERYRKIVVRPVTTSYLRKDQWMESVSAYVTSQEVYVQRCNELARHFGSSLKSAFNSDPSPLKVTGNSSGADTVILEVALTEVTFGRPEGYVGAMAVTGGGLANSAAAAPVTAFEARLRDAATGKLVATASDRRGTTMKIVDVNQLTYHKANQEICDEWSQQLMQGTNEGLFPEVKRAVFTPF